VFAQPAYRRLWAARTLSACGDAFQTVALGLLVFDRTGSGLGVTGVVAAETLPVLLLAPLAGPVVDRLRPVPVMVAADLARVLLVAALPLVAGSVPAIYAVAFGIAAAGVFFTPAAGAALPSLVDPDRLVAANSGIWTTAVLAQILLAPAAGVVYAAAGPAVAFGINAASFAASAVLLARLRLPATELTPRQPWRRLATEGIRLIMGDRLLRALAAGQLLAALSAGATSALLVVYARKHLGLDARGYGLMLAAIGAGSVTGPLLLTRLARRRRQVPGTQPEVARPVFVFGPYLLRAVVDAILATTRSLAATLPALAAYGIATSTGAITFTSLLQATAPPHARGRVLAAFDLTWQAGRLASLALGGALADAAGLPAVYALGAILLATAATVGWRALRQPTTPPSGGVSTQDTT
jgi:MFS family permease